ncbi:short-chain dehydrogenase [Pedobacter sp. PACM 27299]|uniref:SDR family oxidoreductase n=1 Tax=Pedobacter sp. PACM 27299 TaxID=1727164 RepID=UPI000705FDD9|nr:SDR family oxidoreductase [Pedobacter sp. PACM 27299]ALL08343.1 short-chain dehydrogenase [Pedobacter sp. PACM 27299]
MKDKVIWITGASSGIGEALVYAYSQLGAKLIISSRNRDELFRVKSGCQNKINVHVLSLDLENTAGLADKATEAIRIFGKIDLLINSGGISQRGLALATDLAVEQRLMKVNFWGTVALSKAVLPVMLANGGGHIVCISSLVGKFGTPLRSAYSASKHALHGYFDSLRAELCDQGIHITLVCPGFIKTNVTLNALTASGSPQGTMDEAQAAGMLPETCAQLIVNAVKLKKEEVYIGGKEVKGVWLKRFFPLKFSKYIRTAKVT